MPVSTARGPSRRAMLAATLAFVASPAPGREAPPEKLTPRRRSVSAQSALTLPPTPSLPAADRSGTVAINGTRLFFALFGAGEPVLFLHGGFGHSNVWGAQVTALAASHRVIVTDTRGHGRSPVTPGAFGFSTFAKDVEGLLDHLEVPSASVVGWSDGAITGLRLAMSAPQRVTRLFAFGANATPDGLIPGGSRSAIFAAYVARCRADYASLSPTPERWPDLQAGLRAMWRTEPNFSAASLAAIRVPVTIAAAPFDEIIRADHPARIARAIPDARLVSLKNVSHFAMLQDPAGFNAALREGLA